MKRMKRVLWGAAAVAGLSTLSAHAMVVEGGKKANRHLKTEAVPGEFVVQMRVSGLGTLSQSIKTLEKAGLEFKQTVNSKHNIVLVKAKNNASLLSLGSTSAKSLMSRVGALSNVEIIEPNFIYRAFDLPANTPNDPKFGQLWGMKNIGQADSTGRAGVTGADINAPEAWAVETGSNEVIVAVIDTGVDYTHPDLAANIWSGTDANGNTIHGFNAITGSNDPMDDHSHGTHCSGSIAGVGDNGVGVVGVAWKARIQGVKFLSGAGGGTLADAIKAIDWATENGAQVMSNSWGGGGFSQTLYDSIARARDKGVLFVAAAGNDGSNTDSSPAYPASYDLDNIVSVAAGNNVDAMAYFSNFGQETVDLMAPGENILSTVPTALASGAEPYKTFSGTSMATPHVSGAAALLLAKEPSLSAAQVKARLMSSTVKTRAFRDKLASMGRLNIFNMLNNIVPPGPVIPPEDSWSAPVEASFSTPHPYEDSANLSYEISNPGARFIRLTFAKIDLEAGYDFLKVYDGQGKLLESISGRKADGWTTNEIEADTVRIEFTSDDSVSKYGFDLSSYQWTDFNGETHTVKTQAR